MPEKIKIECPFCKENTISTLHNPAHLEYVYSHAAGKSVKKAFTKSEKYELLVDKCPNCGKSKKDIEKALKHGKEQTNSEVLRRLKEAGLDPSKLR